ncbi:MAG: isoprenylcysteine carboxylmethyltransferase family protein [Candidatus Hydrogenedentes bacterium]|nr:isoprenylcysteine carboxylmethyltransferase family protein [Candidatus Hydrogenedentota bacterium]
MARRPSEPPTYFLVALLSIAALHFLLPLARVLSFPGNLLGMVPLILGTYIELAADAAIKGKKTTVKPFENPSFLITRGVYRFSRNPMYLGMTLILLGIAMLIGSATPYIVVVLFPVVMQRRFIRHEERALREVFGEEWDAYARRTRPWL